MRTYVIRVCEGKWCSAETEGHTVSPSYKVAETHFLLGELYILQSDWYCHSKAPKVDNFPVDVTRLSPPLILWREPGNV